MVSETRSEWKIGELAAATGLSVRTLHHYDQIGLFSATARTEGGHRVYTEDDAARLYQIVALRGLGLRLDQIKGCLVDRVDPKEVLAEQLRVLTIQLAAGQRLRTRLTALLDGEIGTHDLLEIVALTTADEQAITAQLDPEQAARMRERHAELGPEAEKLTKVDLPDLYRQALVEFDAGTEPTDPVVLGIVEAIDRIGARLSGDRPEASAAVRRLWAEHGEQAAPNWGIPWAELTDYLQRAREAARGAPS